jgi:hypothetical protein
MLCAVVVKEDEVQAQDMPKVVAHALTYRQLFKNINPP